MALIHAVCHIYSRRKKVLKDTLKKTLTFQTNFL